MSRLSHWPVMHATFKTLEFMDLSVWLSNLVWPVKNVSPGICWFLWQLSCIGLRGLVTHSLLLSESLCVRWLLKLIDWVMSMLDGIWLKCSSTCQEPSPSPNESNETIWEKYSWVGVVHKKYHVHRGHIGICKVISRTLTIWTDCVKFGRHSFEMISARFMVWSITNFHWSKCMCNEFLPPASAVEVIELVPSVCLSVLQHSHDWPVRVSIHHGKRTLGRRNFTTQGAGGASTLRCYYGQCDYEHHKVWKAGWNKCSLIAQSVHNVSVETPVFLWERTFRLILKTLISHYHFVQNIPS